MTERKFEGRHIAGPEAADRLDVNFKKYRKSDKGKEAFKKYQTSEKGKEVKKRYFKSDKGKEAVKRWNKSDKGKEYKDGKKQQREIFKLARALQLSNPEWSSDTCLKEAEKQFLKKES